MRRTATILDRHWQRHLRVPDPNDSIRIDVLQAAPRIEGDFDPACEVLLWTRCLPLSGRCLSLGYFFVVSIAYSLLPSLPKPPCPLLIHYLLLWCCCSLRAWHKARVVEQLLGRLPAVVDAIEGAEELVVFVRVREPARLASRLSGLLRMILSMRIQLIDYVALEG